MAEGADTDPRRVSIYAVISAVTGVDGNHAGKAYHDLVADFPEVHSVGVNFKSPGRGQWETPVTDARGIIEKGQKGRLRLNEAEKRLSKAEKS